MRLVPLVAAVVLARIAATIERAACFAAEIALGEHVYVSDGDIYYPPTEQHSDPLVWPTVRESGIRRALAETEGGGK